MNPTPIIVALVLALAVIKEKSKWDAKTIDVMIFEDEEVRVVDLDTPKAFYLLGKVYVTTALLKRPEPELKASILHELGHKKWKHAEARLVFVLLASLPLGLSLEPAHLVKWLTFVLLGTIALSWLFELMADLYAAKHAGAEAVIAMLDSIKRTDHLHPPPKVRKWAVEHYY